MIKIKENYGSLPKGYYYGCIVEVDCIENPDGNESFALLLLERTPGGT